MSSLLSLVTADDADAVFAVEKPHGPRSTDGGETFTRLMEQADASSISADPNDPSTVHAFSWESGRSHRLAVARSVDKGATWMAIVPKRSLPTFAIAVDASNPARLYMIETAEQPSVSRTRDKGARWEKVDFTGLTGATRQLLFDPRSPQTIHAFAWPLPVRMPLSPHCARPTGERIGRRCLRICRTAAPPSPSIPLPAAPCTLLETRRLQMTIWGLGTS